MSFMCCICSGLICDMPSDSWLNMLSSSWLRSSCISSSNRCRAASSIQSYCWSSCTRPGEVGRQLVELAAALLRELVEQLLAALVARLAGLVDPAVDALAFLLDDLVELAGDVVVDAAEVVAVEQLAALLAQLVEHLAQALDVAAVAVAEALLQRAPQRRVEIAVVEQIVGELGEQVVGVEVEADLGAVPARVAERACHQPRALYAARPPTASLFSRFVRCRPSSTNSSADATPAGDSPTPRSASTTGIAGSAASASAYCDDARSSPVCTTRPPSNAATTSGSSSGLHARAEHLEHRRLHDAVEHLALATVVERLDLDLARRSTRRAPRGR